MIFKCLSVLFYRCGVLPVALREQIYGKKSTLPNAGRTLHHLQHTKRRNARRRGDFATFTTSAERWGVSGRLRGDFGAIAGRFNRLIANELRGVWGVRGDWGDVSAKLSKIDIFAVSLLGFLPHSTNLQTIAPKQAREGCKLLIFKALRAGQNRPKIAPKSPTIAPRGAQVVDIQGVAGVILSPRLDWATARRLGGAVSPCFALFRGRSVCRSVCLLVTAIFRPVSGRFCVVSAGCTAPTLRRSACIGVASLRAYRPPCIGSAARRCDGSALRRSCGRLSALHRLGVATARRGKQGDGSSALTRL